MSLKSLIKQKGFTQKGISAIFKNEFKYSKAQQQISDWCLGNRLPDIKSVYYLSKILEVSTDEIIESVLEVSTDEIDESVLEVSK